MTAAVAITTIVIFLWCEHGAIQNQRGLVYFFTLPPVIPFHPVSSRVKIGPQVLACGETVGQNRGSWGSPRNSRFWPQCFLLQVTLPLVLCSPSSQLLLPAPPLGSLSSGKGIWARGLRQMQTFSSNLGSSWRRRGLARGREDGHLCPLPGVRLSQEGICLLVTESFLSFSVLSSLCWEPGIHRE
jgi:hypothetical protein